VAGPAALANAVNPLGLSVLTVLVAAEGQAAVAGFGAGGRLQTFAVVPLLGLSSAIRPIVGQNWGAGEAGRARAAMVQSGLFCLAYGLAAASVLFAGREWFAAQFGEDRAVAAATARYLAIAVWGYAGYGMMIVATGAFNAIDRAGTALALTVGRVLLVMVPVALLLRPNLGADAVYGAELAANLAGGLAAAAIAALIVGRQTRRLRGTPEPVS
jgi:Na+-driven multidrug efflux pump